MPIAYLDHMYTHGYEVDSEIRGQGRMDVIMLWPGRCHAQAMLLSCSCDGLAMLWPCPCHALAMSLLCPGHDLAMLLPCYCHFLAMPLPCPYQDPALILPCCCHALAVLLPRLQLCYGHGVDNV